MWQNGTVKHSSKISRQDGNGPIAYANDFFGWSIAYLSDLDGDGIGDLAVGAPGSVVSAVHILFMNRNLTVKNSVLIRGRFLGNQPNISMSYIPNGPPISFQMRFGSSVSALDDLDLDGIPDLAVGAVDASSGNDQVFIMFLCRNGTVRDYKTIGSGKGGGPILRQPFSSFGSTLALLGDMDAVCKS
jgi:hypothetical protein